MSSGFITEAEAAEVRKRRQEEWERVRKADDPIGNETHTIFMTYEHIYLYRTTRGTLRQPQFI